jgi:hypothetical protein
VRVVRAITDEILDSMSPLFDVMYASAAGHEEFSTEGTEGERTAR